MNSKWEDLASAMAQFDRQVSQMDDWIESVHARVDGGLKRMKLLRVPATTR